MNSQETSKFAERLMQEVWLPLDAEAVPRFYRRDVIGYHRKQRLTDDDVVHRLVTDRPRYTDPHDDIQDLIAAEDTFAIRLAFTATRASGQPASAAANDFYHLREGKISAFWRLADIAFDDRADDSRSVGATDSRRPPHRHRISIGCPERDPWD
jgi:hypothetical protein